jgi:hypothetical protein
LTAECGGYSAATVAGNGKKLRAEERDMTAETLWIALVVLVGATVFSMVRNFLREPWYLQESIVVVEAPDQITYMQQPRVGYAASRALPANVYAMTATARRVERPSWLDSTRPITNEPESVPA